MNLVEVIENILPQTQCKQCGFDGCQPYAHALANNNAPINLCPPGNIEGIEALSHLLNKPVIPFDANHQPQTKMLAYIDEKNCIGCTHCIRACPVDAIIGSAKKMHTILAEHCTGCALCLPPCPVDCIIMRPLSVEEERQETALSLEKKQQRAQKYKTIYQRKQLRIQQSKNVRLNKATHEKQTIEARSPLVNQQKQINEDATLVVPQKNNLLASILSKAQQQKPSEAQNQFYEQQQQQRVKQDLEKAKKRQIRAFYAKQNADK